MGERLSFLHNLTGDQETAQDIWENILSGIQAAGREDILQNPTVLDLGGGMGEFSKNLNAKRIRCVSLDAQDLDVDQSANPVRGDFHQMPFADASFSIVHARGALDTILYHHDFAKSLAEVARVLKTGGILSIHDCDQPPKKELEKHFRLISKAGKEYSTLWEKNKN